MVTEELIVAVKEKFQKGERRDAIKKDLQEQGYAEEDIDTAITRLQHEALKQLPGIAWIYQLIDDLEKKANLSSPRITFLLMIACIGLLFILAGGLYFTFDPLGMQSSSRDTKRQADITQLQNALTAYYQAKQTYPQSLTQLLPEFITTLPQDPKSGTAYSYHTVDNGTNYELCVTYELTQAKCLSVGSAPAVIPVVPTVTLMPAFVPKSGSGAATYHAE